MTIIGTTMTIGVQNIIIITNQFIQVKFLSCENFDGKRSKKSCSNISKIQHSSAVVEVTVTAQFLSNQIILNRLWEVLVVPIKFIDTITEFVKCASIFSHFLLLNQMETGSVLTTTSPLKMETPPFRGFVVKTPDIMST
jgi:hypothetical protein